MKLVVGNQKTYLNRNDVLNFIEEKLCSRNTSNLGIFKNFSWKCQ